jgi:regulator of replication initiation timing
MAETMTPEEMEKEVVSLVSLVERLESNLNRSLKDVESGKAQINELIRRAEKAEEVNSTLKQAIAALDEAQHKAQTTITGLSESLDKMFRFLTETQKRLDGDSITNIEYPNYETVRESIKIVIEKMAGRGTVSFDEMQTAISNTRFLWKILLGTISVFGVSAVGAALFAFFGVGSDGKVTVQKLNNELGQIKRDVESSVKAFQSFKSEEFKEFKSSTTSDIKTIQNRQWDEANKK